MISCYKDTSFLWEEFFRDPSQFWDRRHNKISPKSPDFKHKQRKAPLWIDSCHNPPWVKAIAQELDSTSIERAVLNELPFVQFQDRCALLSLIKSCGKPKNMSKVIKIHADLIHNKIIEKDVYIATALVSTYAKCGAFREAQEVFEQLPVRDVVSWNALISGYAQNGLGDETLKCFERMQDEGICPTVVTFVCVLKACGIVGSLEIGEDIHAKVRKRGLLQKDLILGNALVDMYGKCGALEKARKVFEGLPIRDVVSWNAMISGYAQHGLNDEALDCFRQMSSKDIDPDVVTYSCILNVCGNVGSLEIGEYIDVTVRKKKLLPKDSMLGNALVDMYAKCGALDKAKEAFELLLVRTVVSWTALIAGYAQEGLSYEALKCFRKMQDEGVLPNQVTYICILKVCGSIGSLEIGEEIETEVRKQGLLQKDVVLGCTLVDMYAKHGALEKAQRLFEQLPVKNVVAWTALIGGYVQKGLGDAALKCFKKMQNEGICPDAVTYICILKACSIVGSLEIGEDIDAEVRKQGLLQKDIALGNTLLDMYAKCGALEKAQAIFEELPAQDVVSWNALMTGYAQLGQSNVVLDLFQKMRAECIVPDSITFLVLLTSCTHAGLFEEGEKLFDDMCFVFSLNPELEHCTCMIDLFCRAGHFDKAKVLLEKVKVLLNDKEPSYNNLPLFLAILGACRKWGNVDLGRWAFEQSIQIDETCGAAYICMENIYAEAGMQSEASQLGAWKAKTKARNTQGCCWWTDANRNVHSFVVADTSHPESICIHTKLEELHEKLIQEGYSPGLHWSLPSILDLRKEDVACGNTEKLAVACALINTLEGVPICITMNMPMSDECHSFTLLISIIEKRRIQVNAADRIHIFEHGRCICGPNTDAVIV